MQGPWKTLLLLASLTVPAAADPPEPAGAQAPQSMPDAVPLPPPRPFRGKLIPPEAPAPGKPRATAGAIVPPDEMACRQELKALGVAFEERPAVTEPAGCGMAHPVWVTRLRDGVELSPGGLMTCRMAEAAGRFTRDVVAPSSKDLLGKELRGIGQASAYVCRPRRGTGRMSEHATGDALDIGSFLFADGSTLTVKLGLNGKENEFLALVRRKACGPFATVLGPGSDADHADHLHLDLAKRRGGPFCQ